MHLKSFLNHMQIDKDLNSEIIQDTDIIADVCPWKLSLQTSWENVDCVVMAMFTITTACVTNNLFHNGRVHLG